MEDPNKRMKEFVYVYKLYEKCFEPYCLGEAKANIVSCHLFANVIKNNITSSIIHIIVCLLMTE